MKKLFGVRTEKDKERDRVERDKKERAAAAMEAIGGKETPIHAQYASPKDDSWTMVGNESPRSPPSSRTNHTPPPHGALPPQSIRLVNSHDSSARERPDSRIDIRPPEMGRAESLGAIGALPPQRLDSRAIDATHPRQPGIERDPHHGREPRPPEKDSAKLSKKAATPTNILRALDATHGRSESLDGAAMRESLHGHDRHHRHDKAPSSRDGHGTRDGHVREGVGGGGGGGELASVQNQSLTRQIGYLTATGAENWSLVLEVCERASSSDNNAKEAVKALKREFKYGEPTAQLSAARLWAVMLRNSTDTFISQSTSRKFLDTLEDIVTSTRTPPVVKERILNVVAAAAYASGTRKDTGFRGLWRRIKPPDKPEDGVPFDTDDAMFSPPVVNRRTSYVPAPENYGQQIPYSAPTTPGPKRRKSPTTRIIPPDEDRRRLLQECRIAQGNASLLAEALVHATPSDAQEDGNVLKEFLVKCRRSHEIVFAQISWATAEADRAEREGKDAGEQELLNELLSANAALQDVLKQHDDLKRLADDLNRYDNVVGLRPRSIREDSGGSRSPSPSPRPRDRIDSAGSRPSSVHGLAPPAPHGPRSRTPKMGSDWGDAGRERDGSVVSLPGRERSDSIQMQQQQQGYVAPFYSHGHHPSAGYSTSTLARDADQASQEALAPPTTYSRVSAKVLGKRPADVDAGPAFDPNDLFYAEGQNPNVGYRDDSDELDELDIQALGLASADPSFVDVDDGDYDAFLQRTRDDREREAMARRWPLRKETLYIYDAKEERGKEIMQELGIDRMSMSMGSSRATKV
ncbi:hypothetical protein CYLTODRAFT_420881 [Cylindrobasidium torrendii FP15055 ss-10]|uniref:VHS domain-containing protein n=1 Tax=Cylindrobasidium torrendii FP15055 ss-10 TaxID=1314674 RepID=A0A0D7BGS5_9AGAR|nr:hypothetical protein CYLTODRAFT_420881 [Cylindrobasidium torrendii FP15055 ss-10]